MSNAMKVSEFMLHLAKQLIEERKVAESTASAYIRSLYVLNGKVPFKNLTFLKKTEEIDKKIAEYADNTQKALYSTLASVLTMFKDKPTYKKVYKFYFDKMMAKAKDMKETIDTTEKTEKQKENWIDWKEVQEKSHKLREEVAKFHSQKAITSHQWDTLLQYTVLSLYTDTPPRRNQDYMDMWVLRSKKMPKVEDLPKDKNFLLVEGKVPTSFVFNKYKTSKTYGQQILPIPNTTEQPLGDVLGMYLKHHPLAKGSKSTTPEFKFLVCADGTPITALNAITRILNKIFGKKIGSSMLRHIFLSSKYDIKEMESDATAMGHSVAEQRNYMKGSGHEELPTLVINEIVHP